MRRALIPVLILAALGSLLLTESAAADFGHFHGGYVTTTLSGPSKVSESVVYIAFLRLPPAQVRYFVIGFCEVYDLDGRLVTNGKFKFTRGSVEGDIIEVSTPNLKGRWGRIVAKEVPSLEMLAGETLVGASNVKLLKRAAFGFDVDCVHAVGEFDRQLLASATSRAEREAIVEGLAAKRFRRQQETPPE